MTCPYRGSRPPPLAQSPKFGARMTFTTLRPAGQMMAYLPEVNADKLAELLVAFANSGKPAQKA